jgi:hypothetical protein
LTENGKSALAGWSQWAVVILTILSGLLYFEGRVSRVEQSISDGTKDRTEILERLKRMEDKLDQWQSFQHPSPRTR